MGQQQTPNQNPNEGGQDQDRKKQQQQQEEERRRRQQQGDDMPGQGGKQDQQSGQR
jgi:hypothetical protein